MSKYVNDILVQYNLQQLVNDEILVKSYNTKIARAKKSGSREEYLSLCLAKAMFNIDVRLEDL